MALDLAVDMIHATVQLEQELGNGTRQVGTGFLVNAPGPDGAPRTVLVTAAHVLRSMPGVEMKIGYRGHTEASGDWQYAPQKVAIRLGAKPVWVQNADHDIAVMVVKASPEIAKAAIPLAWLGTGETFEEHNVGPGDEMMALGFPKGLSANGAGFPILRSGKVASYPLGPSKAFPTFLLDFSVYPGNSGGPVFAKEMGADGKPNVFITGILTHQVEAVGQPLEIGVVTQAGFIRDTVALLDNPNGPTSPPKPRLAKASGGPHEAASAAVPTSWAEN